MQLSTDNPESMLFPRPKEIYRHPTFEQTAQAGLLGKVFYEIHPQLWGQGLMSEAFAETLRFAFEEVGCKLVEVTSTINLTVQCKYTKTLGRPYDGEPCQHQNLHKAWHETRPY